MFGSIVAVIAAVAIKEIPLRTSNEQPVHGEAAGRRAAGRRSGAAASTDGVASSRLVDD